MSHYLDRPALLIPGQPTLPDLGHHHGGRQGQSGVGDLQDMFEISDQIIFFQEID